MTDWLPDPTLTKMTTSVSSRRFTPLPDVFLKGESTTESKDEPQEITVARAEARAHARQRRNGSRLLRGTDRQFAEALHREADSLHYKGDYETALVLYHRAASVCPRDSSHGVAARRTAAAISALAHPSKALNGLLPKVRNGAQQSAVVCPESAAFRASRILNESSDPVAVVPKILGFFDGRADFWRISRSPPTPPRKRCNVVKKNPLPMTWIRKMESALGAGDPITALRIGDDILKHLIFDSSKNSDAIRRCQATTYRLFTLANVALGRHDRAVATASKMTRAALAVDVPLLVIEALVTLGKVHLTFGHLKAAAKAWEGLVPCVSEPIPKAWLFHEIGRCHLENGDCGKALDLATRCLNIAQSVECQKWTFHGRLLLGQAFAQMGRFAEAASALRSLTLFGEEAGDARTLAYVRDLEERLMQASDHEKRKNDCSKVQRGNKSVEENFPESYRKSGSNSDSDSQSNEHGEMENADSEDVTGAEFLYSEESSSSLDSGSPRTISADKEPSKFEIAVAAGDPGDPGEQEISITRASLGQTRPSHESLLTGRTYGVSSPLFRPSVSRTITPRRRDVSDSETVSTIFGP